MNQESAHASDLTVSLVQTSLHWHDVAANLAMFEEKLAEVPESADLVILPEMFSTGFSMKSEDLAEPAGGPTTEWMRKQAAKLDAAVTGSVITKDGDNYFNRLIWMRPNGDYHTYDKRHLFRMAGEDGHYSAGEEKLIVTWKGWNICPLVCYDLRFPVWARNRNLEYDLVLFVANWPAVRVTAWDALLSARSIENLAYSIGVNRTGNDGNGIPHNGHSAVWSPKAERLAFADDAETVLTVSLSKNKLDAFRKAFPAHLDADGFELR